MQIKGLSVEGVGRFGSLAHVQGFRSGVNVLAAGNEAGKSTLFRAIRTCLFSRHDSKSQEIRDLASDESQLPATIELAFEHEAKSYIIKKSFLRSPSASLMQDGREIARGKQADEAVWSILGLGPGTGKSLDDGAFGMLWVGQGGSFAAPVPGPGASSMLTTVIESEVGAVVGGERARQLLDDIAGELKWQLTDSGKPRVDRPLSRALANVGKWRSSEDEHEAKLSALDAQFNALLQHRRRLNELTNTAAAQELAQDLAGARAASNEAKSASQELRRREAEELGARHGVETIAQRLRQHRALGDRIDASRLAASIVLQQLPQLEAREAEARTAMAQTEQLKSDSDETARDLSRQDQRLARLTTAVACRARVEELNRQLEVVERAAETIREIDAQLSQISVDQEAITSLDSLERQLGAIDAQLSAAAARLTVELRANGAGQILVDGAPIENRYGAAVVNEVSISVGSLAEITVTPAANLGRQKRQEVERQLSALLARHNAATPAEARALLTKRRDLEAERKAIRAQLPVHGSREDAHRALGELKQKIAEAAAVVTTALADGALDHLPSAEVLDEQKSALDQQRSSLNARRASLEETSKVQRRALESAVGARSAAESKLEVMRSAIAQEEVLSPPNERASRESTLLADLLAAEATHETARAMLDAVKKTCPDGSEIERREMRCTRLEQAIANRANEITQLSGDIGHLSGQIQSAGGDGVGEALAAAREERTMAERECASLENRVAVLQLLRETVSTSLAEGRERYYEPVRRHLRPFLDDLFPGAELELGDDFAIAGIKRHRSEALTRLSDGTQEQIAVLVRLALGAMLAEQGKTVPIILDDALVYCDDDRIQHMFDALNRAGRYQQVIVLTCRSRTFATLGGNALRLHQTSGGVADLQRLLLHTKRDTLPSSASTAEIASGNEEAKSRTLK